MLEESAFQSGSLTLHRATFRPSQPAWARLALLHGYGDHGGRYTHFLRWLAERGVLASTFDFRGQGQSQGKRGFVRGDQDYLDDLQAFLHLPEMLDPSAPLFLLGHSHGGLIAAIAGIEGKLTAIHGCILSAPFLGNKFRVPFAKVLLAKIANSIAPALPVGSGLNAEMMTHDEQMRKDMESDPLLDHIGTPRWFATMMKMQKRVVQEARTFSHPLLCLTADEDPIADNAVTRNFFDGVSSEDRTFKNYPGFRHEILREVDREVVFDDILQWMKARS